MKVSYLILFLTFFAELPAQSIKKIKFAKSDSLIYFFQLEQNSDTLKSSDLQLFYLAVPENQKCCIRIDVENGMFEKTDNENVLKLIYVPGIKYETLYRRDTRPTAKPGYSAPWELNTRVNGSSSLTRGNINCRVVERDAGQALIENLFIWFEE